MAEWLEYLAILISSDSEFSMTFPFTLNYIFFLERETCSTLIPPSSHMDSTDTPYFHPLLSFLHGNYCNLHFSLFVSVYLLFLSLPHWYMSSQRAEGEPCLITSTTRASIAMPHVDKEHDNDQSIFTWCPASRALPWAATDISLTVILWASKIFPGVSFLIPLEMLDILRSFLNCDIFHELQVQCFIVILTISEIFWPQTETLNY